MIPTPLVAASIKPFVLSVLAAGESYGYAIIRRVRELTRGQIAYTTSTLYPVLHSLEDQGLVVSEWRPSEEGRRRKYYRLTDQGKRALEQEKRQWLDVHRALVELWSPAPGASGLLPA